MADQAQALRALMKQVEAKAHNRHTTITEPARFLGFTSAKGGVGKTTLALKTALAFANAGKKVCVWDVDGNASHDLLSGFQHSWTLSHLLTGARTAQEILATGPNGIEFVLGTGVENLTTGIKNRSKTLESAIAQWEQEFDVLILDLPGAGSDDVRSLVRACDSAWLVCTTEPTAVAASYTFLKQTPSLVNRVSIVVNQVDSPESAFDVIDRLQQTTKLFLQQDLQAAGFIPSDSAINSVESQSSPSEEAIQDLSQRWLVNLSASTTPPTGFFQRFETSASSEQHINRVA